MEIYNNSDKSVTKYLHEDGSETAIKIVPSCNYIYNKLTNKLEEINADRNKYSIFISHSSGCPIGCKMCYLTIKKYPYHKLYSTNILKNIKAALKSKVEEMPELKERYIKVCWMGMGDAFLNLYTMESVTILFLDWVFANKYAIGLDGVDIGTVFPNKTENLFIINDLNRKLYDYYNLNPENVLRSPLRIIYSLHKFDINRYTLIPNTKSFSSIYNTLKAFKELCNIDVIFHQLFLDRENDSKAWVNQIKQLFSNGLKDFQLRILRYNTCKGSPYVESMRFDEIIQELNESVPNIKYQISPGSEIKAACGQFIMGKLVENSK